MRLFYKMKKLNNKGFSLVELVVAIALFAIVVTPVMNSFITSARVNRDARKVMIATDVAQNIVEGFSEKTFEVVRRCGETASGNTLSGTGAFTTINGSTFNVSSNWILMTGNTSLDGAFSKIEVEKINFDSHDYYTVDLVSDNTVTREMNRRFEDQIITKGITGQNVFYYYKAGVEGSPVKDIDEGIIMMAYTNIEADTGYKFNAVIDIIPVCNLGDHNGVYSSTKNYFFSYVIKVSLYDALDPAGTPGTDFGDPIVTVLGGIPNK